METIHVRSATKDGFRQKIDAAGHPLVADEPESAGGENAGPDPYALLLSALGACTSMTVQMYARRKGWPLEEVAVTLTHQKVHAEDCAACEGRHGLVDRIERRIVLKGPLDDAQRARLADIAAKCPVHKTLQAGAVVVDELRPAD